MFRRAPSFYGVAILTLSLCIGANSALFSVIDAVLLRPLPFERADELYVLSSTYQGTRREFTSIDDFSEWRARGRAFSHVAAVRGDGASVTTPGGAEYLAGAAVSEDFFAMFGVQPVLGRAFTAAEYRPGQRPVAILGHDGWLRRFAGDPSVVGSTVVLAGEPHIIVGVLPRGFAFPDGVDVWRPLTLVPSAANLRADLVRVVARRRTDVSPRQAQAELTAIARELEQRRPATNAQWGAQMTPLQAKSTEDVRRTLLALWGAVGCVLLIACANVGIMLLSRGIGRTSELAVRAALGADRGRVVRQLLTESMLIGACGGAGGLLAAAWGLFALRAIASTQTTRFCGAGIDLPVLLFTTALSLGTGLLVGLVPVWRISRSDLHGLLRGAGGSGFGGLRHHHLMRLLAAAQIAISLVLLIGAGLMIGTLARLQAVNLGFDADRLLTFYVSLPERRYAGDPQVRAFYERLLERVRALPGVRSASAINALYIHWSNAYVVPVTVEGRPAPGGPAPPDTHVRIVDAEIHRVLRIPILRGRSFTARDGPDAPPVVVINESMAKRYFAGENPIGHRISVLSDAGRPLWTEIVGVVGDVRQRGLDADVFPEIEMPYAQSPLATMAIVVRAAGEPSALAPAIRGQVQAMDRDLPLMQVQTMEDVLAASTANRRTGMRLLSAFAAAALILTALGLYGVMAAAVGDRAREIAVRLALGALPSDVVRMVVGRMAGVAAAGVSAGAIIALGATRALEPLLFGVPRTSPAVYGSTAAILAAIALVSSYLPARRAAHLDPAAALRSE
jgi:putative ABC transport system permease protein